jgi:hypothetical protein
MMHFSHTDKNGTEGLTQHSETSCKNHAKNKIKKHKNSAQK